MSFLISTLAFSSLTSFISHKLKRYVMFRSISYIHVTLIVQYIFNGHLKLVYKLCLVHSNKFIYSFFFPENEGMIKIRTDGVHVPEILFSCSLHTNSTSFKGRLHVFLPHMRV